MREYIQERWCDYADGLLSLAAVSVTTNTAFEYVRFSESFLPIQASSRRGELFELFRDFALLGHCSLEIFATLSPFQKQC
jgi:hypothetical protein